MKKFTKIAYYFHIIFMSIIFILTLLGLILNDDTSVKSIYTFNLIQSILFLIIIIFTPRTMQKNSIQLSDIIYLILVCFCSAHFFLGEICGFYAKVTWWDSALHLFSGMIITFLSFSFITLLNDYKKSGLRTTIEVTCLLAFCMSVTTGVLWEVIEFTSDSLFSTNMQRAYESIAEGGSRGEPLLGQFALLDTMKDLILDALGSIFTCLLCLFLCKKKNISLEQLTVIKYTRKIKTKKDLSKNISHTENISNNLNLLENHNSENLEENQNSENLEENTISLNNNEQNNLTEIENNKKTTL